MDHANQNCLLSGIKNRWHGSVDILMGQIGAPVAVDVFEAEAVYEEETPSCSVYAKQELSEKNNSQILAETIVSGCVQKKIDPDRINCLVPTIAVCKNTVRIYFFDPEFDILLKSSRFNILEIDGVFALWLALNYKYLETGVTETMVERNFHASFIHAGYEFYVGEVVLGDCVRALKQPTDFAPVTGTYLKKWKRYKYEECKPYTRMEKK